MHPARVGAYHLFCASFLFPIVNGIRFWIYIRAHESPGSHQFMSNARGRIYPRKEFNLSPDKVVMEDFVSIGELVQLGPERIASMDYRLPGDRGRFKVLKLTHFPCKAEAGRSCRMHGRQREDGDVGRSKALTWKRTTWPCQIGARLEASEGLIQEMMHH